MYSYDSASQLLWPNSTSFQTQTFVMNHSMKMHQKINRSPLSLLGLLGLTLFASPVTAQVFDLGPSDPAFFDTVINLPTDPDIGDAQSVGGGDLLIQLNIAIGGNVGDQFDANNRSEVNISGGVVGEEFEANGGSEVNLDGGQIGRNFEANVNSTVNINRGALSDFAVANSGSAVNINGGTIGFGFEALSGSEVNISGGSIGRGFFADSGSDVELIGGQFQLNGAAFSGSTISLNQGDTLTGILADGSAFIFSESSDDSLFNVQLTSVALPPADLSPIVLSDPAPITLTSLRPGQTLTLLEGGNLRFNFEMVGATLDVEGGTVGTSASAANSTVNISAGTVENFFDAFGGSVVNVSGGDVGDFFNANNGSEVNISGGNVDFGFDAFSGSEINISGGDVDDFFEAFSGSVVNISGGNVGPRNRPAIFSTISIQARPGSEVNITGGNVGDCLEVESGSVVNISGGTLGDGFRADAGSDVELIGSDFQLNGEPFTGSTITLTFDNPLDVLTGVLADGSAFIFSSHNDTLNDVQLTSTTLPPVDLTPIFVSDNNPDLTQSLRLGQTLTVQDGGALGSSFEVVGATLNVVEGGSIGNSVGVSAGTVNISGGSVGDRFDAFSGSVVNISGGTVGPNFDARSGSVVNISGGEVATDFARSDLIFFEGGSLNALSGSVVNISGGEVGGEFSAGFGSEVNISGGTVGPLFDAFDGSTVNISGGTVFPQFYAFGNAEINISGGSVGFGFVGMDDSVVNISGGTMGTLTVSEGNISGGNFIGFFRGGREVNLFGSNFALDGEPLDSLTIDDAFTIVDRDVTLTCLLADGSPFTFELNSTTTPFAAEDFFGPGATLTVTLVSDATGIVLGDVDQDGEVTFADIPAFIEILTAGMFLPEADVNQDSVVNFDDIPAFIEILTAG